MIEEGDKLHIIARRIFDRDLRRHFVGEVEVGTENVARVKGYAFIFDQSKNEFIKKAGQRIRLVSLTDALNIINVIPRDVDLESLSYCLDKNNRLTVTDGKSFRLDVNEFGASR